MNDKLVYALLDPRKPGIYNYGAVKFEYEPFYIGKGNRTRPSNHAWQAKRYPNKKSCKLNKIRKIQEEMGKDPIIYIIKNGMMDFDAKALEGHLLKNIGSFLTDPKGPLTNVAKDSEHIPPGPKGDDHYSRKFPGKCKEIQTKAIEKHGYKFLSHTKEGITRASLKVADGTSHLLGPNNPNRLAVKRETPSVVCAWLRHYATPSSKLGWYLRLEIEKLQKENQDLGYKRFAKLVNKELNLLEIYGLELDENLPMKIAKYKKWTPKKLQYWQEWKESYNPIKLCQK